MSAAPALASEFDDFDPWLAFAFDGASSAVVVAIESEGLPAARGRWLQRFVEATVLRAVVHAAGDGLFLMAVREVEVGEAWLLVERLRRQLAQNGWARVSVGSAMWRGGESAMDAIAAAVAGLTPERDETRQPDSSRRS